MRDIVPDAGDCRERQKPRPGAIDSTGWLWRRAAETEAGHAPGPPENRNSRPCAPANGKQKESLDRGIILEKAGGSYDKPDIAGSEKI